MARSMAERLDAYGAELEAQADELLGEHPSVPRSREREQLPNMEVLPTRTHFALVDLMDRILELGQRYSSGAGEDATGGVMLRTTVRTIRKLRPYVLEQLAKVPEDEVRAFMGTLVAEISAAINPDRCSPACSEGHTYEPPCEATVNATDVDEGPDGSGQHQLEGEGAGAAGGRDPGRQVDAG